MSDDILKPNTIDYHLQLQNMFSLTMMKSKMLRGLQAQKEVLNIYYTLIHNVYRYKQCHSFN